MGLFSKRRIKAPKDWSGYDYSTPEGRVKTAEWLFERAKNERAQKESEWKRNHDYYSFRHDTAAEVAEMMDRAGLSAQPCVPDPYIMVESQLTPDVPEPEFHGRDGMMDGDTAKQRQFAVKYIIEANRLEDLNTSNERRLWKLGDAFWKAYYDETMPFGEREGNIRIRDVSPEDIYPDPTAGAADLQGCEYVDYVYTMHKLAFWRLWQKRLQELGMTPDEILSSGYRAEDGVLEPVTSPEAKDDRIQILEHWFRQPFDAKEANAGDIACSIQAGGVELKYIPKYWQATGRQCKLFPFVHYWIIRDETQFWNRSELDSILDLVDAADRELATGLFNDAMMSNDIILVEEGALAPGEEFTNVPGSQVKVKQGKMGGVARLGGLHDGVNSLGMVEWLQGQIQRTNRNYDTNNGKETARVTTSSGLLQLRGDAEAQQKLKKADRDKGFCRLYELLDWLALEFFDDDRLLVIGAKNDQDQPETMQYNGRAFARMIQPSIDPETGMPLGEPEPYYPRIDVTVTTGAGLSKNPQTTVEVLDKLAGAAVTADNWQLLAAELEYLDIPQKQEIVNRWREKFQPAIPPEITQALENNPELLAMVAQVVQMQTVGAGAGAEIPMMQGMPMEEDAPQSVQPSAPVDMLDAAEPNRALLLDG